MPDVTTPPAWRSILLVDDHPLFRGGVEQLLRLQFPDLPVRQAGSLAQARALLASGAGTSADLALLDLALPDARGIEALTTLRHWAPALSVVVISAQDDPAVALGCLQAGAMGFIHKSVEARAFMDAIGQVAQGVICLPPTLGQPAAQRADALNSARALTPRQQQVLMLLLRGCTNKQMARVLDVAESTIKSHVTEVMRALGASTRVQAVVAMASLHPADWLRTSVPVATDDQALPD